VNPIRFNDLCGASFPPEIYEAWIKAGIVEALPVQRSAVQNGLFSGESLLVIAPTSSGKTFLGEMLAVWRALNGSRAIYLVPFKAIAEERYSELMSRYSNNPSLGLRCIVSDRDHHESDSELLNGKYDIAILTYEKLSALLVANQVILDTCGSVIIDEVQLVSDENRGPGLELLLTKIRKLSASCQLLGLSAVLGDLNDFDKWIGCKVLRDGSRPVELRTGVVAPDGRFDYREANSGARGSESFRGSNISVLTEELLGRGEQVLIFASSVRRTTELAHELAVRLRLPAATNAIKQLKDEADTETREELLKSLCNGVAFHNADCELPERLIIEQAFRAGEIRIMVSTTTLSMGVNLPVDNVILADNRKWTQLRGGWTQIPWRTAEVRNILGRAGRLGKSSTFGRGLLLSETPAEKLQCRNLYLDRAVEPLFSALGETNVDERVLTVVASGYAQTSEEIEQFLFNTFAGQSWGKENKKIIGLIRSGIKRCADLELIEISPDGAVKPTALGCVCAGNHLTLNSFASLKNYILGVATFDALDASFAAASVDEVKTTISRIRWNDPQRNLVVRESLNKSYVENKLVGMIQQVFSFLVRTPSPKHDAELAIASVCRAVLETNQPMRELCSAFRISGGNLRQMCENVAWIVDAMAGIAGLLKPQNRTQFEELAACLKKRAPFSSRYLNDLPSYISRDERIKLVAKGIERTEAFLECSPSQLTGIMSPTKADRCMKALESQRIRGYDFWQRDHARRLDVLGFSREPILRIYSDKGRDLEHSITDLFNTGFARCHAERIADQRSGEPDVLLLFDDGQRYTVQITAKDSNAKYVDSKKAGDVIPQSARFKAGGFVCIGRPDFETLAREQAGHLGLTYNYKQIPLFVLAEIFVLVKEGRLSSENAEKILTSGRGYISFDRTRNVAALQS
jgi:replicative superfamily II helicase